MGEILFVTFIAVGVALSVIMLMTVILFVVYITLIEIRYWRRQIRIRRAHKAIQVREAMLEHEQFTENARVERKKIQAEKTQLFLDNLRKAIDES